MGVSQNKVPSKPTVGPCKSELLVDPTPFEWSLEKF